MNKTSKINGDGSGSMKGIHWGKIGASGCRNLLLLEWGFVKLAKQYCINQMGKGLMVACRGHKPQKQSENSQI